MDLLLLSDLAQSSEQLLQRALADPGPLTLALVFAGGALVVLGSVSGLLGRIYGQVPALIPTLVAILAVAMGLNLLGVLRIPRPSGPDPEQWRKRVPAPLAPVAAGLAFGLAAAPCTPPVLAVLLGWIAQSGRPGGHGAAVLLRNWPGAAVAAGGHLRRQRPQTSGLALHRPLGATDQRRGAAEHRPDHIVGPLDLTWGRH